MAKRSYAKRTIDEFNNPIRKLLYLFVTRIVYMTRFKLVYRLEIHGKENIPNEPNYIVAPNHLSTLDAPLIGCVLPHFASFMAKQELFDIPVMRLLLDLLGAFAVNREHLEPSTIKTAKMICKSNWVLGLFPQGKRGIPGQITEVNKGFTAIAKLAKCDILPIGIVGTHEAKHIPFTGKIVVNIGKIIPYNEDSQIMTDKWIEDIQQLTGFKYEGK